MIGCSREEACQGNEYNRKSTKNDEPGVDKIKAFIRHDDMSHLKVREPPNQ